MRTKKNAFTLVEMLVVIAIIGILAGLLLPALAKGKMRAQQIQCVSNLKQIGIAFHSFLHDHNNLLPMEVSTNDGGTLEYIYASYSVAGQFYFQYRNFQALSNELANPAVLVCPADRDRMAASNWPSLNNLNISYFVGANADYSLPNSILAGDRNVTNTSYGGQTIERLADGSGVFWTADMHRFRGNILYADARVEEINTAGFQLAGFGAPQVMDIVTPTLQSASDPTPSGLIPLSPPPNLPVPPMVTYSARSNPGRPSYSGGSGGGSSPSYSYSGGSRSTAPGSSSGSTRPQTGGGVNGYSDTRSNRIAKAIVRTNAAPVTNKPVIVVAQAPAEKALGHLHSHWWFWLWLLLLLLAVEGTRRYYKRLREEQANRSPWAR